MRWISIDPAIKTGIAEWSGPDLVCVSTLRPATKPEAKNGHFDPAQAIACDVQLAVARNKYTRVYDSTRSALIHTCVAPFVVVEESFGDSPKTIAQMGERRGYIEAMCDGRGVQFRTVNTSEWRKVCGDRLDKSWPAASKAAKQRSIDLVAEHCDGLVVTGDEGDAYWVGRAAMWLGLVKL